jgi:light-regulated signal transduction histidine kinase (bacteriophytochrome)
MQIAIQNILEDSAVDRQDAETGFRATLNILDDLGEEKALSAQQAETLARVNADLQASNRELELFAYVASHDLSEPLRAISGPISLLARQYRGQLDAEADSYIAFAVDGCQRMQTIINDLLAYSRAGRSERSLERVDMNEVLAGALAGLQNTVETSGARITIGAMPTVEAERSQLSQVFQNLISNALKFSRPGVEPCVTVSAERIGDRWEFSVIDNGIGIDPAYHERVFGMFKRLHTRDDYPGTGIGLALCKKIVERHRGAIGVTNPPDGGSRFWFTLAVGNEVSP